MPNNIFVYGTLSIPEVLSAVVGRDFAPEDLLPAALHGYRRHAVAGVLFPVIRKNETAWVDGFVIENITNEELHKIDQWEQGASERIQVEVNTEGGTSYTAWAFADTREIAPILEQDWDIEAFRNAGKLRE